MKRRDIYNDGALYLRRYYLIHRPGLSVFIHVFYQPDQARELHNHPWKWCLSMPLLGGYVERLRFDGSKRRRAFVPRLFRGQGYHSVESLTRVPTVTLFVHGRQVRTWGFLRGFEHVPWFRYLVEEGFNTQAEIDQIREETGE